MIDCQNLRFSPALASQRIVKAEGLFGKSVIRRILSFALFLVGASRTDIARTLDISFESLKTTLRTLHRNGLPALEDRRRAASTFRPQQSVELKIMLRDQPNFVVVELGQNARVCIPRENPVQLKTVVLSLVNADLISAKEAGQTLDLTSAYVRELAKQLEQNDVGAVLLDKRRGQIQQYRMTPEKTARLIERFAAHAITGKSTASHVLAEEVDVSDRTVRLYARKLGLPTIVNSLPELVTTLKKTS